jgi:Domain of unknown function (DUF4419)
MLVTTKSSSHGAKPWWEVRTLATSSTRLLQLDSDSSYAQMKFMRQSSFDTINGSSNIYASANGFLVVAYRAYIHHHHLIIRPNDVWLAILVQLNFYINANSEELRDSFVSHEARRFWRYWTLLTGFRQLSSINLCCR